LNTSTRRPGFKQAGFTLAEVAVTIVIIGIGLVLVLQGLNGAKLTAAQTRNHKLARELALLTLGEVESGIYWDDIESGMTGSYEDYPDFYYELVLGEDQFLDQEYDDPNDPNVRFDNWAYREELRREQEGYDENEDDEEEEAEEFEKIKIRVTYPKISDRDNKYTLEKWVPWAQVYGEDEEDTELSEDELPGANPVDNGGGSGGGNNNSGDSSSTKGGR